MATHAVIGGGIAGLSAAWRLQRARPEDTVMLLERSDRVGGKLRIERIAGHQVDVGAESALSRRPEVVGLIEELDLPKVHPAPVGAQLWSRGQLHALPARSLMGVPSDVTTLVDVLTPEEIDRVRAEQAVQAEDDISVGDLVERALGAAVVDRLVEPLLGGVYAGQARALSAQACMPVLYDAARQGLSLTETADRLMPKAAPGAPRSPIFASVRGGIGSLPAAMAARLERDGVQVRTGVTVHGLSRVGERWQVHIGGQRDEQIIDADTVVLATPARTSAKLLDDIAPETAQLLKRIDYASMAVITYAFPSAQMPALDGSGFLVPSVDDRTIKASTFSSIKWPWVSEEAPELTFVRVSIGRAGEEASLQRSDDELAAAGLADLEDALGTTLPAPVESHVQRWGGGLPQYAVGHVDLVAAIRDSLASLPAIQLAGAAYDGVGIPATIASAYAAVDRLIDQIPTTSEEGS